VNVVIANRLADFFISLKGISTVGQGIFIDAGIQPGHNMAYIARGVLVALAIIKVVAIFITWEIT